MIEERLKLLTGGQVWRRANSGTTEEEQEEIDEFYSFTKAVKSSNK